MERKRITVQGLMKLIADLDEAYFDLSRRAVYKRINDPKILNLDDYFPSEVKEKLEILKRKGWAEKMDTDKGVKVILTESGRRMVLDYDLANLQPLTGKWDGKWRLVLFDVEERFRRKRKSLVKYLDKLGLKRIQDSVYVGPFDYEKEIKYLREVLDIPHGVKLATATEIENEAELRGWFNL